MEKRESERRLEERRRDRIRREERKGKGGNVRKLVVMNERGVSGLGVQHYVWG